MELRPYQAAAVREILVRLKQYRRVVAVSPTASGKTVIGAAFLRLVAGRRVLWLVHRFELVKQAIEHLREAGVPADQIGMLTGRKRANESARILVASVGMFQKRTVPVVDLIVVDEAHHVLATQYRNILNVHPDVPVLGLTATPCRLDGQPLGDVFQDLYIVATTAALIADKYIMQAVCYGLPREETKKLLAGVKQGANDYNDADLERKFMKRALVGDLVKEWERLANDRSTILFAITRKHGKAIAKRFADAGHTAEYLDGETPHEERDAILSRLKSGATMIVVNVAVLDEGFDCPEVKCVVMARPTKSLTRFLQQCGRALRPHGKKKPRILDHAGNCDRFDLPHVSREWSLFERPRRATNRAPLLRRCKACGCYNHITSRECSECGSEFPKAERELEEKQAKLKKLDEGRDKFRALKVVRKLASMRGLSQTWTEKAVSM